MTNSGDGKFRARHIWARKLRIFSRFFSCNLPPAVPSFKSGTAGGATSWAHAMPHKHNKSGKRARFLMKAPYHKCEFRQFRSSGPQTSGLHASTASGTEGILARTKTGIRACPAKSEKLHGAPQRPAALRTAGGISEESAAPWPPRSGGHPARRKQCRRHTRPLPRRDTGLPARDAPAWRGSVECARGNWCASHSQ